MSEKNIGDRGASTNWGSLAEKSNDGGAATNWDNLGENNRPDWSSISEDDSPGWDEIFGPDDGVLPGWGDFLSSGSDDYFNYNREVIHADSLSRPMKDFFERQGFDLDNLPPNLGRPLLGAKELGDMYFKIHKSEAVRANIFVGDIVGSQGIKEDGATLDSFMSYLYSDYDSPGTYGGRSVHHLERNYKEVAQEIIDNIGDYPCEFVSDGNLHFLCGDGDHRMFFLATALEMELAECGDDENEKSKIISKYTIPAMICPTEVVKDLNDMLEKRAQRAPSDTGGVEFI